MFQVRCIRLRLIPPHLIGHHLHFPTRTGRNGRDNRVLLIHLMQLVTGHPYAPHLPFRLLQHILRGTEERHFPLIHQRHTVAGTRNIPHDMRRQDNRHVILTNFRQQVTETDALFRVEPRSRLVHDNHLRMMDQRLGNPQTALHTSRQLVGIAVAHIEKPHVLQHLIHRFLPERLTVHSGKTRSVVQKLVRFIFGKETEVLRKIPQYAPYLFPLLHQVVAADIDFTGGRFHKCDKDTHQGGLTCAIRPQQPEHTGRYFQIDIF